MSAFTSTAQSVAANLHRAFGESGTMRRPHSVVRIDGVPLVDGSELTVAVTAAAAATSLIVHVRDSGGTETRARGVIPAASVLTIGGTNYTVAADATFGATTASRATVTLTSGLAAEATAGDAIALSDGASWTPDYILLDFDLTEAFAGFELGAQKLLLPGGGLATAPVVGYFFDGAASDGFSGKITRRKKTADGWEVVVT